MSIVLRRFISSGPGKPDAEVVFSTACLIRGPSETGKSYIRDCLWYLFAGDKHPKRIPEDVGYDTLALEFSRGEDTYTVIRGLAGGDSEVYKAEYGLVGELVKSTPGTTLPLPLPTSEGTALSSQEQPPNVGVVSTTNEVPTSAAGHADAPPPLKPLDVDLGELLVDLSGAGEKQILRSASKKGAVTAGDLRHWFLLSQPAVISEDPTTGTGHDKTQRAAAFYVFLTGMDDAAIVLTKSKAEKDRISGRIGSAEDAIRRSEAGIPPDLTKLEVLSAIDRVDETLTEISKQYDARASALRDLRERISTAENEMKVVERRRQQSQSMVFRFELLEAKYLSDLERLNAIDEGVAYFNALKPIPCPLCGTPIEQQLNPEDLRPTAPARYRVAAHAEAQKIRALTTGLTISREAEFQRVTESTQSEKTIRSELDRLERQEQRAISGLKIEFSTDPKTLAVRRSDLAAQLNLFEDVERLKAEIDALKKTKSSKPVAVMREAIEASNEVSKIALQLLRDWGLDDVKTIDLDTEECDLVVNNRPRLSYGAGKRALFLSALSVALLRHAMTKGYPHLGVVVIDSPLKAYADPDRQGENEIPLATIRDGFYSWLSKWQGPGQIVILENEKPRAEIIAVLHPVEFTGSAQGRSGFYPASRLVAKSSDHK